MSKPGIKKGIEAREKGVFVPRWVLRCSPSTTAAVVLSQILWFYQPWLSGDEKTRTVLVDGNRWLFLSDKEWEDWTGLDEQAVRRARSALTKSGLIQCRAIQREGIKRNAILPNLDKLQDLEDSDTSVPTYSNTSTPVDKSVPTPPRVGSDVSNKSDPTYPPLTTEVSEGYRGKDGDETAVAPTTQQVAHRMAKDWWDERKLTDNPPSQSFIAVQKVIECVLRNGVKQSRVEWAIRNVPVVSSAAIEMAIQRRLNETSGKTTRSTRREAQTDAMRTLYERYENENQEAGR